MRNRASAAIAAFAGTEEKIASVHEDLAARHPEHRDEYLRVALEARARARKASEMARTLSA